MFCLIQHDSLWVHYHLCTIVISDTWTVGQVYPINQQCNLRNLIIGCDQGQTVLGVADRVPVGLNKNHKTFQIEDLFMT